MGHGQTRRERAAIGRATCIASVSTKIPAEAAVGKADSHGAQRGRGDSTSGASLGPTLVRDSEGRRAIAWSGIAASSAPRALLTSFEGSLSSRHDRFWPLPRRLLLKRSRRAASSALLSPLLPPPPRARRANPNGPGPLGSAGRSSVASRRGGNARGGERLG